DLPRTTGRGALASPCERASEALRSSASSPKERRVVLRGGPESPQIDLGGPTVRARPLDRTLRSAPPSGAGPRSPRAGRAARDGVRWSWVWSASALEQDPPYRDQDRPDLLVRLAHGPPPLARSLGRADPVPRPRGGAPPLAFTHITETGGRYDANPGYFLNGLPLSLRRPHRLR